MTRHPLDAPLGLRLPRELVTEIRDLARDDDRTVSAYVRRVLAAHVEERRTPEIRRG